MTFEEEQKLRSLEMRNKIEKMYAPIQEQDIKAKQDDIAKQWIARQAEEQAKQDARPWYDKLASVMANESGVMDALRGFSETMKDNPSLAAQYHSRYSEIVANKAAQAKQEKEDFNKQAMDRYMYEIEQKQNLGKALLNYDINQEDNARALQVAKMNNYTKQWLMENKTFAPQQPSAAVVKQNAEEQRQAQIAAFINSRKPTVPTKSSGRKLKW